MQTLTRSQVESYRFFRRCQTKYPELDSFMSKLSFSFLARDQHSSNEFKCVGNDKRLLAVNAIITTVRILELAFPISFYKKKTRQKNLKGTHLLSR